MVSLEERLAYSNELKKNKKVEAFLSFLFGNNINVVPEASNATDSLFFKAIDAILNNDKDSFAAINGEFAKREPDAQTPFVHDDFLLFILICGIKKFSFDSTWIQKAINARNDSETESLSIKTTFTNIVRENYSSNDNLFEIVIVFQSIIEKSLVGLTDLNETYKKIANANEFPPHKSPFFNIISFRAFDLIILSKNTPNSKSLKELKDFKKIFAKRIQLCSAVIYFIFLVSLIYAGYRFIGYTDEIEKKLNALSIIFQILGVAIIGSFNKTIRTFITRVLKSFFGYKFTNTEKEK